jgi:hypothetical protein
MVVRTLFSADCLLRSWRSGDSGGEIDALSEITTRD